MDFYDRVGRMALGSRLRRLGDRMAEDAAKVYALYGNQFQPRWFPVFHVLTERSEESVTAIADDIGHTHASVSQIVREMKRAGFVTLEKGRKDSRKTFVSLSPAGRRAEKCMRAQYRDVGAAVETLLSETRSDLWQAVAVCEQALARKSLYDRVDAERRRRECEAIRIVDFEPRYARAFRTINEEWIRTHFGFEDADRAALENPQKTVIDAGGSILIALDKGRPVGVCALVPHGERCFELAKMGVRPAARGKGIGHKLGVAAIEWARAQGANRLYLESNRSLESAIHLYRKLGFEEVDGGVSPYARCDIQMELRLG